MNDVKYKIWYEEFDSLHSIYIFKSPRGGAKSYSLMDYSINDFIDNFNQFFWLRRKESEILTERNAKPDTLNTKRFSMNYDLANYNPDQDVDGKEKERILTLQLFFL